MNEVRFGDVVRVAPRPGMRCVIPASGNARAVEVPADGVVVIVDLMVLRLLHHRDLVVVAEPAKAAASKEQK